MIWRRFLTTKLPEKKNFVVKVFRAETIEEKQNIRAIVKIHDFQAYTFRNGWLIYLFD